MTSRDIDTLILGPIQALTIRLGELEKRLDSLQIVGRQDTGSDIQVRFKEICSAAGHDADAVLNGRGKTDNPSNRLLVWVLSLCLHGSGATQPSGSLGGGRKT